MRLTERERATRRRLRDDFVHYAERCLVIRTKAGRLAPFVLNPVQAKLHDAAERQRRETGRVRLIVLKARQGGVSTYVEGRLYWRVTHRKGVRAFILTHSNQATNNLFAIAKRFHDNCPEPVKPSLRVSNARALDFAKLDSGYRVGTAKVDGVGRSDTIQFFHGSEVAHWPRAAEHAAGALQAVPRESETEIWLESTANGVGGYFYTLCMQALHGDSEYRLVFLPWTDFADYRAAPPDGWRPPAAFAEYGAAHGLSADQLYWAYVKNAELAAADARAPDEPCPRFRQEYPATVEEAFQASGADSFVPADLVVRARKARLPRQDHAPLVLGVDVARGGGDKTRLISRQGRLAGRHLNRTLDLDDLMEVAAEVARAIDRLQPAMVFVDVTGLGSGVYDRLRERGYGRVVTPVNFAQRARDAAL
ncbi:MAG: hypothetical protein QNJ92_16290, partial [Alphaproteobacteria bacterium]|nr:hypothetical protein [Alphaproteobacteria bacterium]